MELIGELERSVLPLIYPLRVPIFIATVVVLAILAWIAWRRGWVDRLRAHPRATAASLAIVLVIGLPVGWYLGSPLFIRTALVEPTGGAGAAAGTVLASGSFVGADEFHTGSGRATIVEAADGRLGLRFDDFVVRNGPDLFVYLSPSPDGYAEGALELGALKATDGSFGYDVPAGTEAGDYRSVVVWCKAFAVQFAHAALTEPA
ncbi:MAG TPA: DM13 domain-containing protein [Candidatus Limnocylindrales bacterium]|nr:DM13 domain-containing protein [Candidatus Limnocylindrales bacterium]